jgi:ribosomal 30S subunit maturation factor RimM
VIVGWRPKVFGRHILSNFSHPLWWLKSFQSPQGRATKKIWLIPFVETKEFLVVNNVATKKIWLIPFVETKEFLIVNDVATKKNLDHPSL